MSSLKEVKSRISSVRSTRQITSAMKMVASAKLHKAQGQIENMLPYQRKLNGILTRFLATDAAVESPYTKIRPLEKVAVVVLSSNTSLCGAFNANVIKLLEESLEAYHTLGKENIVIYPIGKKVEMAVTKLGYTPQGDFQKMADRPSYSQAQALAEELMNKFATKEIDQVILIYHHFKSMGTQILTKEQYLPIDLDKLMSESTEETTVRKREYRDDYIVEPSAGQLIADLLPKVLSEKIYTALLDSNTSEHAARTLAMQTATDNANDLIQDLTKQYNKGRQQAITNELLDIIGGSMK